MQPNSIAILVDTLNNGTTESNDYNRHEEYLNRSVYIGDNHSLASRDQLSLFRTFPKVNGNFRGTAKTSFKFTKDISVPGVDAETTIVAPMIVQVNFSFPVGVTDAQALVERQKVVALLDMDTIMVALNSLLMT